MHTPRRGADRDAGERTTRGVMSSVFGPAEEQALPEEARVRHVCLYPAWRREQLGAFLSQPPLRLIRGRMTSRGRAAGVARERRWGAPECEPCEKHARLGVHMDVCVCVHSLAGAAEGNCSQQDGAGYQPPRRRKHLYAKNQPSHGRCCRPAPLLLRLGTV